MQEEEKREPIADVNEDVAEDVLGVLSELVRDVTDRNTYINERDRVIYENGLFDGVDFPDGSDKTLFNFLQRAVQIHKSQLMGRGVQLYSTYNKEDLSIYLSEEDKTMAEVRNKQLKEHSDARKQAMDAIVMDNGGVGLFERGAEIASAFGGCIYKMWADRKEKKIRIALLETPQNYFPVWSDSDFRDRDGDGYVYQISIDRANKLYGKKLKPGKYFSVSNEGNPFGNLGPDNKTSDPLSQMVQASDGERTESSRKMVAVVEYTGIRSGWSNDGKKFVRCRPGDEKPFNVLIVGGEVVQTIFQEKYLPQYYLIPNIIIPRRAWGGSDINDPSIDINRTIIEVMSTWITLYHKEVAPLYVGKGFSSQNSIPRRKKKQATFVPASLEQSIEQLQTNQAYGPISKNLIDELKDALVRTLGIGRVLFDDPTVNANSNQALMTTLKGVIDIVETKQKIWEPVLVEMFTNALNLAATMIPELKDAITDPGWKVYLRWPSVLRREDATYQQMWLNRFNAGTVSVDSYLEAMGVENTSEEVDRIRDDMSDPVRAAIQGKQLGQLAAMAIMPQPQMDPSMAQQDQALPQLTPDQNTGQSASMPGSGAPAVSPKGANAMMAQRQGA